ncbi:MAG: FtsW/RodA/SpoVE family cell cycle protein, partial [Planctomycetota bacterium]|jgi:hypothetical protein
MLGRPAILAVLAMAALLVASRVPVRRLANLRVPVMRLGPLRTPASPVPWLAAGMVLLLLAVYVPGLGKEVNGARRWIDLGFVSFQPSEVAKWGMLPALAMYATRQAAVMDRFVRGLVVPMIMVAAICVLIVAEDLGTAVLVGMVATAVLLAAGAKLWHAAVLAAPAALGLAAAIVSPAELTMTTPIASSAQTMSTTPWPGLSMVGLSAWPAVGGHNDGWHAQGGRPAADSCVVTCGCPACPKCERPGRPHLTTHDSLRSLCVPPRQTRCGRYSPFSKSANRARISAASSSSPAASASDSACCAAAAASRTLPVAASALARL